MQGPTYYRQIQRKKYVIFKNLNLLYWFLTATDEDHIKKSQATEIPEKFPKHFQRARAGLILHRWCWPDAGRLLQIPRRSILSSSEFFYIYYTKYKLKNKNKNVENADIGRLSQEWPSSSPLAVFCESKWVFGGYARLLLLRLSLLFPLVEAPLRGCEVINALEIFF